ncbi:ESPR-type extended signal peptide-containing protein [Mitsuokella jalaludinii]|uniref:ESPR-type extended signal peptide-containing protein n=2 Tax=Mitsuokella jalaludinii TaxID=187979 RepID=UPI003078935F
MNKVFKVIWSDARSAYVVVSEIAKNHGSKSCSTKKLLAMLIATGVMTCASVAPVMAANLAPDDYQIEAGNGASASGQGSVAIGNKAQASGLVGIAIGRDAVARGDDSIAIGSQTQAGEKYSVAVGNDIGYTAYAGTAVGQQAYASGSDSTAIGTMTNVDADYNRTHDDWRKAGKQSTAIGAYAGSWGEASASVGVFSKAEGNQATAVGYASQANAANSISVGGFSKAEGEFATALGYAGKANGYCSTALGDFAEANVNYGVALGGSSVADRRDGAVGAFAPEGADSLTWKANRGAVSVGSETITRQITNVAAGSEATDAVNVAQLRAVTENAGWNLSTGKEITNPTKVKSGATVDFSGDGENITVSKEETDYATLVNVKLNKNLNVDSVQAGDFFMNNKKGIGFGGNAYITKDGLNANDKVITNVAKGKYNTDAVNVGQLKKVEEVAANANKGWNLSTNGVATEATNVAPGENVDFSGDKNISVSNDKTKVKVELNKDLVDIESISNGDAKLTLGGFTTELTNGQGASVKLFGDTTTINNAVTVYKDGRIAGVAAGINDNDAVNVSQLKNSAWKLAANGVLTEAEDVKAGDYVDFSGDQNVSISKDAKDGVNTVKVELNKDLTGIKTISNDGASLTLNGTATELTNGKGAAITLFGDTTTINNKVTVYKDGRIAGVAAGINDNDAVNVGQLKAVGATANMGWNLATNGVATEATNVKPGDYVDFSGDKNISVSHDGTKVKVELNKDIDVNSVQTNALNAKYNLSVGTANENGTMPFFVNSNGAFYGANNNFSVDKDGKVIATAGEIGNVVLQNGVYTGHSALRDGELFVGDASGNYSQITTKGAKLGKVTVAADGKISGVAAGAVTADSTDAVNGSQLHAVATEAGKHSKVVNGSNINVEETDLDGQKVYKVNLNKDIMLGDLTGKNVSISGTNGTIEATGAIATKDRVYADKGARLADIDVTGDTISNGDAKLALNGAAGTAGMINGKGASVYMQDGYTVINSKVAFDQNGKISGVAAGAVTADSTDAVNGSQLHAVATEAGKHSKVVNGSNINVEETDLDGQKVYKVNLNKDIMLGDLTGKNVSISGTNGTIEATGAIATKDRVYADKGAKLADIDVTGNKIFNGASSIVLDGSNVKVNDKVTIDQNGKISGVAAGEVSSTSTDAINGSQLNQTNENVAALDKRVTQNEADIAQNKADIAQNKADIAQNKADIVQNKTDIKNLDNRVTNVEELAKKHTTVTEGDNIAVTESTNKDGGKEYKVALDKDINLDSVTTGQTVMNNDGLKVGKDVSVTATAVTAGKTSISDEGVKVGDKTYISDKGLNANDQKVTNVAAGELSATSKDAVNGSQLYETKQAIANNATNISSLSHSISNLDNRVNKVGAGAAALAALHPLDFDPDAKWDFAAGYGNYRGANAAAVGAYYRPNEDTMFSVGGTFGNGENMVNAGVSFKLGSGSSHVSTSRVAMAKEIKELRGELEAMKSAMLDANAGKKIDTSKLQLFPDVPQNHWAYEYVAQLAGNGMIEGYPDGNFAGDRPMTRYEFAAILYRAMTKGAVLSDKILSEFSHELEYFTVDTIAKDKAGNPTIQRVRTVKENKNK